MPSDARWRDLSRRRDFSDPPPRRGGIFIAQKSLRLARARAGSGKLGPRLSRSQSVTRQPDTAVSCQRVKDSVRPLSGAWNKICAKNSKKFMNKISKIKVITWFFLFVKTVSSLMHLIQRSITSKLDAWRRDQHEQPRIFLVVILINIIN